MATVTPNLEVGMYEVFGPKTSEKTIAVLNPDQYSSNPDTGRAATAARAVTRSTWMACETAGSNVVGKDNVAKTVTAVEAAYLAAEAAVMDVPMSQIWS